MLALKKTLVPAMSALFLSTAMIGFAQAEEPCGTDLSGDVEIKPCPDATAEAEAEAAVERPADMVGDLDGDKPLTAAQQVEGQAPTTDPVSGDEPTNQPMIDTTQGND